MRLLTLLAIVFTLMSFNTFAKETKYTCPMHPHYIATEMGTCPICGMDLVPMETEETSNNNEKIKSKSERKAITISAETIQNMGVRTEKVQLTRFGVNVRSYGLVSENVRLKSQISSRISGWVEELTVKAVGDVVTKGDLLFKLYSPELISAQQDYVSALLSGSKGRISSSAKRLESLGVQKEFIQQLKKHRKKQENVPFYAQVNGIVSELMVNEGAYVKPGMQIATLQDYSSVWINVSVAEKDLEFLSKDSQAKVVFPNLGELTLMATIDYIYPTIDTKTRTGQVRLVLDNKEKKLKPGSYADVEFDTNIEKRLAVPSEAILKSSDGHHVVVSLGDGKFQSQKVTTGIQTKGRTEILSGLKQEDDVVVSSQFLIDSESALRESFRKLQKTQTPLSLLKITEDQLAMINHLLDAALYIHESLTTDVEFETKFLMPALKLNDHLIPQFRGTKLQFILEKAKKAILAARNSITDKDLGNELNNLVTALKPWLFEGKPEYYKEKGLKVYMDHGTSFLWLQLEGKVKNPYSSGHSMLQEWPNKPMVDMPELDENSVGVNPHANH